MNIFEKKYEGKKDVGYLGTFAKRSPISVNIFIPINIEVDQVSMQIHADGMQKQFYQCIPMEWKRKNDTHNIYECVLDIPSFSVGLYYYKYEIKHSKKTEYYGFKNLNGDLYKLKNDNLGYIQLLVYNNTKKHPDWLYGGIMYHIFVDRFKSSGKCSVKKNAILNTDWDNGVLEYPEYPGAYVENNTFFGGDLFGVAEKLDYIKSLGVKCIYLSPIFEAYSNHKYDTADYMRVDSMFGGDSALDYLVNEAKKRNISIILDGVFNHTGSDSVYFNKKGTYDNIGAYQSKNSKYYKWYNFRNYPDEYECWWNIEILPRVMSDSQSYRSFIMGKDGVVEKWMNKGIAGFRLDVADELSDRFLRSFNKKLKNINPNGIIYGEVWEDASNKISYNQRKNYFNGYELDSVMNYPLKNAIIDYILKGDCKNFENTCTTLYSHYTPKAANLLMNILGTHDTERILTVLAGESSQNYTNDELVCKKLNAKQYKEAVNRLKLAYTIIATMPGIPCIFYGDEAGMEGYRDPFNRKPFPWGREDNTLTEFYKLIGSVRTDNKVYKKGLIKIIRCDEDILAFARYEKREFIITVINRSKNKKFRMKSSHSLKDLVRNKHIRVVKPNTPYILKGKGYMNKLSLNFDEIE
ncbi:MAG: glycoside hydrolase family 13 protein [Clostridia bacterium]|nr:glycoside hydrolase family 13 protein [Clostridia bacterium]